MTFGERLRLLREEPGLKQLTVALELGVSPTAVSYWEHDKRWPGQDMLVDIAEFWGVSIDWLLGRTKERKTADEIRVKTESPEKGKGLNSSTSC